MNIPIQKIVSVLLITIFLFLFENTFGQAFQSQALQNINEENGLSDNAVQCIFQDYKHFTWIGTSSGLNLVNGSAIKIFKNNPSIKNSISNNFIKCIAQKNDSTLVIGTESGIELLNTRTNEFRKTRNAKNNIEAGINCICNALANTCFFGTSAGLYYLDENNIATQILLNDVPGDLRKNNNISGLAFSKNGILWITTFNGLWKYDIGHKIVTHVLSKKIFPQLPEFFTCICLDNSGFAWIGTWDKGLIQYDMEAKQFSMYPYRYNITSLTLMHLPLNKNILGMNGSCIAFDLESRAFSILPIQRSFPENTLIRAVYISPNGWTWLATEHGAYFYNPVKSFFTIRSFSTSLSSQDIALLEWNGSILVGGSGKNFLNAYSPGLQNRKDFPGAFTSNNLTCLSLEQQGKDTIVASTNMGIITMNKATKRIERDPLTYLIKNAPSNNFIPKILHATDGQWWIFPWRNGIWNKKPGEKKYSEICRNFLYENNVPKPLVINDAVEDSRQNIWMADLDEGIIFYDHNSGKFSKPFQKILGDRVVTSQIVLKNNVAYSFTGNKIFYWDIDGNGFQMINLPAGMDKNINSIALDTDANLWLATQSGLLEYNFQTRRFIHFTTADGLPQNNLQGKLYSMKNGDIIFANTHFLFSFQPTKMLAEMQMQPTIFLEKIFANDYVIPLHGKNIFNHTINHFIFQWVLTDYNNPLRNRYYYRLAGIDSGWRFAGNTGEVEFVNLSPGKYSLEMFAENANGIASAKILTYGFEIRNPFWLSWWFVALMILCLGVIFYTLYLFRMRHFKRIEQLRNKISLDLHDDIGSTLSSISILSEMALQQNEKKEMLNEIKENSLELMERMDDIVWSINPVNDSMEMLLLRIKTFSSTLFEAKNIQYEFNFSPHISKLHIDMETRRQIYLLMKEAVNNIIKYAKCTTVKMNIDYQTNFLKIHISDNGIGFEEKDAHHGNGIHSMKQRAKWLKADFKIQSQVHAGTNISLSMKIK